MTLETDRRGTVNSETRDLMPVGLVDAQIALRIFSEPHPAMLLASDGRTPLWSSHDAARQFGYRDAMSLMRGRLPETAPGTRRLAEIGAMADPTLPVRVERLRYFVGFRGLVLTALCRTIRLAEGRTGLLLTFPPAESLEGDALAETLAAAARMHISTGSAHEILDPRGGDAATPRVESDPSEIPEDVAPPSVPSVSPVATQDVSDLIRSARAALSGEAKTYQLAPQGSSDDEGPTSDTPVEESVAKEPALPERFTPTWLEADMATRRSQRFIFETDRDGRITQVAPQWAGIVGSRSSPATGESLVACIQRFDTRAAAAIDDALALGETWSGLVLQWPVADSDITIPVELSALPRIDGKQEISGYSGFGRYRLADAKRGGASAFAPGAGVSQDEPDASSDPSDASVQIDQADAGQFGLPLTDSHDRSGDSADDDADIGSGSALAEDVEPIDEVDQPESSSNLIDHAAWASAQILVEPGDVSEGEEDDEGLAPFSDQPDLWQAFADTMPDEERDDPVPATLADVAPTEAESLASKAPAARDAEADNSDSDEADPPELAAQPSFGLRSIPLSGGRRKADPPGDAKVVSILNGQPTHALPGFQRQGLSMTEKNAFREIAKALGARFDEDGAEGNPGSSANQGLTDTGRDSADRREELSRLAGMQDQQTSSGDAMSREMAPALAAGTSLTDFLDQLPLGMLVLKGDQPLFANRTLLDLAAYPDFGVFLREGGARAIFRKGIAPRPESAVVDPVVLATRDGEMVPVDAHLQLIDWDGAKATLISFRRAVELEQGKALRTVAFDLKRSRGEAQELRAILDTATDGVVTVDAKGHILSLNGSAEALFGASQNEIVGEHMTRLFANESHAIVTDYLDGMKSGGVRSVLNDGREVEGREKKGGTMPLFMTLGRISEDHPPRFCAVLRDITAWKRAEADLTEARRTAEQASAKKSDFLAKISHEIRTPMNAIMGFAEVMQEERLGPVGTPKYKEYLADIRTSGHHVVSLVNDLLDLAKIEAGRMELNFQATDINAIVTSSVAIIQPQANAARVLVRSQLASKLPPVVADERSIRQIVLNILSNATRFTEAGGQVIVSTSLLEGGEAVIRIRDTGIGMSPTDIDQALEPFRQVGRKRDKGGTGLGLPLTKALVEANRANFSIRSRPGEGTLVEVTFPVTRVLAE